MSGLALAAADVSLEIRRSDGRPDTILDLDALAVPAGASVAVTGVSGAGKTSLIHVLGGLVRPRSGTVRWGGTDVAALSERDRVEWRRTHLGLVFQDFHLVPELSALDNIILPSQFTRRGPTRDVRARARVLIESVGLRDAGRRAVLLSRGEQQRCSIARALLLDPPAILADAPTASLDPDSARAVADLLVDASVRGGATLIVATHDRDLIARLGTTMRLQGGRRVEAVPA